MTSAPTEVEQASIGSAQHLLANLLLICGFVVAGAAQLFASEAWVGSGFVVRLLAMIGVSLAWFTCAFGGFGLAACYNLTRMAEMRARGETPKSVPGLSSRRALGICTNISIAAVCLALLVFLAAFVMRLFFANGSPSVPPDSVIAIRSAPDVIEISLRTGDCILLRRAETGHLLRLNPKGCAEAIDPRR